MAEKDSAESGSTRVTGVSAKILSLLKGGTKSTAELIAEGFYPVFADGLVRARNC